MRLSPSLRPCFREIVNKQSLSIRFRSSSSTQWLTRARNDPFARNEHRSRAFFKLEQMDKKYKLFSAIGLDVVLDLGCSPGGWSEYVVHRCRANDGKRNCVLGVDLLETSPIDGATFITGDIRDASTRFQIVEAAQGKLIRAVLSDMAPNTTGDAATDHFRSIDLSNLALGVAESTLSAGKISVSFACKIFHRSTFPGGFFLCKIFRGRDDREFESEVKAAGFSKVQWLKPEASRSESREVYLLAQGFTPRTEQQT